MRQKIVRHEPMDLSIYLVTDTVMCGKFGVAATVSAAVGAGVTVVQLRDEDATDDELGSLGREVMAVLHGTDVPLIVNDRVHLIEAMGAHGAHVGQSDLGIGQARALHPRAQGAGPVGAAVRDHRGPEAGAAGLQGALQHSPVSSFSFIAKPP